MKVFVSQPMANVSKEQILRSRNKAIEYINKEGHELCDSYFTEDLSDIFKKNNITDNRIGVWYLGKSIMKMAECQIVYFCKNWENNRGCVIEHDTALKYGLTCIYENEN